MPQDNDPHNPLNTINSEIDAFIADLASSSEANTQETPAVGEPAQSTTTVDTQVSVPETVGDNADNQQSVDTPAQAYEHEVETKAAQNEVDYRALYIAQLESQVNQLKYQNKPAEQEQKKEAPLFTEEELDIPKEMEESYSASSPYIQAMIRRTLKEYDEKRVASIKNGVDRVEEETRRQQMMSTRATDDAFAATVRASISDLDSRVNSAGWKSYLNSPAPFSGGAFTVSQMLESAVGAQNLKAVKEIVGNYKLPSNPMSQMSAPGKSQTSTPTTVPRQQPKFAYSTYQKAADGVRLGTMTYDKFSEIEDRYLKAYEEEQVDFDA